MTINSLSAKLIEKKGEKAEIEIEGQKINVSSDYLPASTKNGENLELCFSNPDSAKMKEKELARAILEEILNGDK